MQSPIAIEERMHENKSERCACGGQCDRISVALDEFSHLDNTFDHAGHFSGSRRYVVCSMRGAAGARQPVLLLAIGNFGAQTRHDNVLPFNEGLLFERMSSPARSSKRRKRSALCESG